VHANGYNEYLNSMREITINACVYSGEMSEIGDAMNYDDDHSKTTVRVDVDVNMQYTSLGS
jgi:hypothetical protein